MKQDRLVAHKNAAAMNDYVYQLTELGRERAKKFAEHCTYFGRRAGAAGGVHRQRQTADAHRSASDRRRLAPRVRRPADRQEDAAAARPGDQLGPRHVPVRRAGQRQDEHRRTNHEGVRPTIWIPRAIGIDGEIMRLFDPGMHEEMPLPANEGLIDNRKIDNRWVRIRRPTIVVGGELTMDHLEVTLNTATNVSEAPVQMKSNCGTLVIDDFGRQRMTTDQVAQSLDRAAGKALRLSEPGQRQEDSGAVRSADRVLDQPGAEGPGRRRVPAADSRTRSKSPTPTSSRSGNCSRSWPRSSASNTTKAAVDYLMEKHYRAGESAAALLPAARSHLANSQLLPLRQTNRPR